MTRRGQLAEGDVHACATAPLNKTPPNFPPATQIHVCSGLTDKQSINEINEPPWYWDKDHRSPTALRAIFWTAGHWFPLRFNIFALILAPESNSALFRKPVRIANEVRLMNESAEGIKLLWDGHCSWFQAVRQAGMEDWWMAIVHSLALTVTPDVWPGSPPPSTSDTPQNTRHVVSLIEWLDAEWYLLLQPSILTTLPLANMKMDHGVYSHRVKRGSARAAFRTHKLCNLSLCFSQREMRTHPCISSEPPSATIRSSFSVGRIKSDK